MSKIFLFLFCFCIFFSLSLNLFSQTKIDINIALLKDLEKIIGIGPALGQRIINARPFSSINDLLKVKGIGEKTLLKIKEQGLACVNCAIVQTPGAIDTSDVVTATTAIYPSGIYINEILPNPEGPDEQNEWVELYNSNNFDVLLSGWRIKDIKGSTKTYLIPALTKILANGFLIFKRPDTKIVLNNNEDGLELTNPNNKIIDSVMYRDAPNNQSYNKSDTEWFWNSSLTPGTENIIPTKNLSKSENSVSLNKGLASLNQENIKNKNPWFLFFTALTLAIFSAVFILFVKFKFQTRNSGKKT
jgi:hypothetical protein